MSQPEDSARLHSLPPPSYEEVVHGVSSQVTPSLVPRTIPSTHHSPSEFPSAQHSSQQHSPHYLPQQHHIPNPYSVCPPGAEPLCDLSEILVYPSSGRTFKIKDHNKVCIMTVKRKLEGDCCGSCTCDHNIRYTLRTLDTEIQSAYAFETLDSYDCCSYSRVHLEVRAPLDAPLGTVRVASRHKCTVENQSGDVLYKLIRQKEWLNVLPYQIFTADEREVGRIDNTRGIKNRLILPKDMPVQHKIILLFFTVFLQHEADSQRRSN